MKILFITSTRIGDAVLTTGLLKACLDLYPDARVTLACGPLPLPLFQDFPRVEKTIPLVHKSFSRHWFGLWKACVKTSWDLTIDVRGSGTTYFLKSRRRYVWRSKASSDHRAKQLADLMKLPEVALPYIAASPERIARLKKRLPSDRSVLALAPAANWLGKEWPLESFIALAQKLIAEDGVMPGGKVALFAAPHERVRLTPLIEALTPEVCLDFVGEFDLLDVSALMRSCDLFVGNDSGLMHMAAASEIPTVGLFGPSRDEHYAPYGKKTTFIRTPETYEELMARHKEGQEKGLMENLSVEDVLSHIRGFWREANPKDHNKDKQKKRGRL